MRSGRRPPSQGTPARARARRSWSTEMLHARGHQPPPPHMPFQYFFFILLMLAVFLILLSTEKKPSLGGRSEK